MGRGSSGAIGRRNGSGILSPLSDSEKDTLREKIKELRKKITEFAESHMDSDGGMTEADAKKYTKLQGELDALEFDLFRSLSPTLSGDRWKGEGTTELSSSEAAIARIDLLKNHDIYMAVKSAEHGTSYEIGGLTINTALDNLYERNPSKVYNAFSGTRRMMRKKYGDTITLYRAGTVETGKATINMTTSRENAMKYAREYGTKVTAYKVAAADVLAVNVTRSGKYEEVIVLNKGRKYSR